MNILIAIIVLIVLYICLNKIYRKYWNRGLNVELSFDTQVLTEDETGHITEIISNDNFLPIPSLWIKFGVDRSLIFNDIENVTMSDKCYKNDIFSIQLYQRITKKLSFKAEKLFSENGNAFTVKTVSPSKIILPRLQLTAVK